MTRAQSSSQVSSLLLNLRRSLTDEPPTEDPKAVVPASMRLAPKPKPNADYNSDEDYYGNADTDAEAMVLKPSTYFTIEYATLTD